MRRNRLPVFAITMLCVVALCTALCAALVWGRVARVRAATARTDNAPSAAVVELFTSEGCSSCPPADELLRQIAGVQSQDGQMILALSEHVTYWNNLGWADPFSQEIFTDRQSGYVSRLGLLEAYTPQAVVNGRTQFVGSDRAALVRALHDAAQHPGMPLTIEAVNRDGDELAVQLESGTPPSGKKVELWAAVTDDSDESAVKRGENGGRTLRHIAVVRSLRRVGTIAGAGQQTVRVPLTSAVTGAAGKAHHVALLAQVAGQGPIVGAAAQGF